MALSSNSLPGLVQQAQAQGGAQSQSPDARAVATAAQMGGKDLIGNLQRLGQGDSMDARIRSIQKQAERSGYSDQDRQMIKELRAFQGGAAQDARSLGQINFSQAQGGGGGEYKRKVNMSGGGDELSMLAQLLGEHNGALRYNQGLSAVGMDHNLNQSFNMRDSAISEALQPIYNELLKQKQLETQAMEQKVRPRATSAMGGVMGGMSGIPGMDGQSNQHRSLGHVNDSYGSWNSYGSEWAAKRQADPYADVRKQAIAAALAHLQDGGPYKNIRKF